MYLRDYGVIEKEDLSAENIYKTLNEVFKDVDREYDYAVIYNR